ncbi:MAG TPA: hypothetical protein VL326_20950 [Kofleriaceae bacterium]|nr:hypothetical protein [Kofleriaceae bacterium]
MRPATLALMLSAMGCAEPQVTEANRPQYTRPLVTDQLPFFLERGVLREQQSHNDWCLRRTWPHSDEFAVCDPHPYLNRSTPPMVTIVRYNAADRAMAYAVFTPVPCRMYGRCDSRVDTDNIWERDLVDHDHGLRGGLLFIGESAQHHHEELPSMQQRMVDALTVELDKRFGAPVWRDPHQYGSAWSTATADVGLFVVGNGAWVVETHELRGNGPPGLAQ